MIVAWLKIAVVVGFVSFTAGFMSGGYAIHRWYAVDRLEALVAKYREDRANFRQVLDLNQRVDLADDEIETSNREILDAINRAKATPAPSDDDPVCISADGMRNLARLR